MRDLMSKIETLSAIKLRDDADYELKVRELNRIIMDLKDELEDKHRKLETIPYLERELANLRDKYESDMRIK
jgi:predicted RNase H-like nuclease (RuvC/YqgF family)